MDNYTIKKTLGEGGFGTAELVEKKSDKTLYVIKTMVFFGDEKKREFAEREVEVLKRARHYNVVRYHEHWFLNNSVRIVLAYCDEGDLGQAIKRRKTTRTDFDNTKVLDWFSQLLFGLKYLHDIKVIHRDLKPGNLLLCSDQRRLLISDFGLSRFVKGRGLADTTEIGTIYYMAPELFSSGYYTTEVDVWATGCIMHEAVNLSKPFSGINKTSIMNQIVNSTHDKPRRTFCADIVEKCLRKKGNDRPEVEELIDLIDDKIEQKSMFEEKSQIEDSPVESESTTSTEVIVQTDESSERSDKSSETNSVVEVETSPTSQSDRTLTNLIETNSSTFSATKHKRSTEMSLDEKVDFSSIEISVTEHYKHQRNSFYPPLPEMLWVNDCCFCSFGHRVRDACFNSMNTYGHSKLEMGLTICATLRSDGKVVTGNEEGEVFSRFNGKKFRTRKVHKKTIWQMCDLTENKTFTASGDGTVNVLGPDFEILSQMRGSKITMDAIANYNNTIATGNRDGKIWFYDLDIQTKPKVFNGHSDQINSLAFKNDLLASGSDDKTIKLWRPKERDQPVLTMKHISYVTAVLFSELASKGMLFSCSDDKTTATWNIQTGQKLNSIKHPTYATCLNIHPNGYLAATGHESGVSLSDLRAPKIVKEIKGNDTWRVKFSPNGNRLGITESNGSVNICDIRFQERNVFTV